MNTKFIINEKVCFFSDEHRLEPLGKLGSAVTLNVPASRCLLLLLERAGDIVSQSEFINEVWESKGQYANANTYFQNIHLLRKALKIAGIDENIIKTVPKEGLRFFGIVTCLDEGTQESNTVPTEANFVNTVDVNQTNPLGDEGEHVEKVSESRNFFPGRRMTCIIASLTLFLFGAIIFMSLSFYTDTIKNNDFFHNYQPIGEMNRCQVYVSGTEILRQHNEYLNFIQSKNIQCQPNQVAYMTMNVSGTRVFVHICDKGVSDTATCLTKFYIVEKKDER